MTQIIPQCLGCKHFHNDKEFTCEAFPKGIPEKIIINEIDHRISYTGDHGIRFELKEDDNNKTQ